MKKSWAERLMHWIWFGEELKDDEFKREQELATKTKYGETEDTTQSV